MSTIPSSSRGPDWKSILVWVLLCLIWSSTWMAIKVGLNDLPPLSFAAIRFVIAAGILFGVCCVRRIPVLAAQRSDYLFFARTGFLTFTVNYGLLFWGEQHVSSGLAAVLQATIPLFGMVFAHWHLPDEPMRLRATLGAVLGLSGVGYICSAVLSVEGTAPLAGGLAVVFGAASVAYSNVLIKARRGKFAPAPMAAWQMFFGALPLLALGLWREGNPAHLAWTRASVSCLLYLALVGSSLAFLLFYWLMARIALNKLQTTALVIPPLALLFGWTAAGERIPLGTLAGAALVLIGLGLIFWRPPSPARHSSSKRKPLVPVPCELPKPASGTL